GPRGDADRADRWPRPGGAGTARARARGGAGRAPAPAPTARGSREAPSAPSLDPGAEARAVQGSGDPEGDEPIGRDERRQRKGRGLELRDERALDERQGQDRLEAGRKEKARSRDIAAQVHDAVDPRKLRRRAGDQEDVLAGDAREPRERSVLALQEPRGERARGPPRRRGRPGLERDRAGPPGDPRAVPPRLPPCGPRGGPATGGRRGGGGGGRNPSGKRGPSPPTVPRSRSRQSSSRSSSPSAGRASSASCPARTSRVARASG